jgi:hypothetical protein
VIFVQIALLLKYLQTIKMAHKFKAFSGTITINKKSEGINLIDKMTESHENLVKALKNIRHVDNIEEFMSKPCGR